MTADPRTIASAARARARRTAAETNIDLRHDRLLRAAERALDTDNPRVRFDAVMAAARRLDSVDYQVARFGMVTFGAVS